MLSIDLPISWNFRNEGNFALDQYFISLEKIEKKEDLFTVGATITLVEDATSQYFKSMRILSDDYMLQHIRNQLSKWAT